jgi:Brp/Blh family beta-carotene 15,15'-monooxygenase
MLIALAFAVESLARGENFEIVASTLITLIATATMPVLISFALYFCGWHSVRGLIRLKAESGMNWGGFLFLISPLSVGAIALICAIYFFVIPIFAGQAAFAGIDFESLLRMTFIGLSSIAVPHLLLHEFSEMKWNLRNAKRTSVGHLTAGGTA